MKKCKTCSIEKPLTEYHKHSGYKDGHGNKCKLCRVSESREYNSRPEVRKRAKKYRKIYYAENKQHLRQQGIAWYENNQEYIKAYRKRYYEENKEMVLKKRAAYRAKNIDKINAYRKTRKAKELDVLRSAKRRALIRSQQVETVRLSDVKKMLLEQNSQCKLCMTDISSHKNRHLDHIIPIAKGGEHSLSNLQWLCAPCNHRKHTKIL